MEMCHNGKHQLEDIYSEKVPFFAEYDYVVVVRWCSNCGAIVIDKEHDGRLFSSSTMRFPAIIEEACKKINR
jgi:hypothetical protein